MTVLTEPVTLPATPEPESIALTPRNAVQRTRSPFSFAGKTYVHAGQMWRAEVDYPQIHVDEAREWIALLSELSSGALRFHLGDPARTSPAGTWSGTPVVKGASQTGQTLVVDGFNTSETDVAKAGDLFQLGSGTSQRLHQVVEDASSDINGEVTLKIWPRLRESPADNESIVTDSPEGTFELAEDLSWAWQPAQLARISFIAVEAI